MGPAHFRNLALILGVTLALTACSEKKSYYFKETVKEVPIPLDGSGGAGGKKEVKPYAQSDDFTAGHPSGAVDFLFVVDNTDPAHNLTVPGYVVAPGTPDNLLTWFKENYTPLLNQLDGLRDVDFRVQVVSAPNGKAPDLYYKRGEDRLRHTGEVFGGFWDGFSHLFGAGPEGGREGLNVIAATSKGLVHPAFENRAFVPLFLVYIMGNSNPITSPVTDNPKVLDKILGAGKRGRYQTHIFSVAATGAAACGFGIQPYLGILGDWAARGVSGGYNIHDLCNLGGLTPGGMFGNQLARAASEVLSGKLNGVFRDFILSRQPFQAEGIEVVSDSRGPLQRTIDYNYDANTNVIRVRNPVINEKITVSYTSISGLITE